MGWLQKRTNAGDTVQFYNVGQNKSILLVGLGNPGKKYDMTRHNVGYYCLDHFVDKAPEMEDWIVKKDLKCQLSSGRMGENRVIAIKPTTFMNNSGEAVQATANFYKIPLQNIIVIHDELDIEFGSIRMRKGGSSAGHNGIKSVTEQLGEDYNRVRIGIGPKDPPQIDSADFVLQKFAPEQLKELPNMAREVNAILTEYLYSGILPADTRRFII